VNVDTRENLARRYTTAAAVAGWVAVAGIAVFLVGFLAEFGVVPNRLEFLAPLGVIPMLLAGIVSMGAAQLADRYREPVDEDGEQ
jgi:hypothetical protein